MTDKRPRACEGRRRRIAGRSSCSTRPKTRRRPMDHGGRHAREVGSGGDAPAPVLRSRLSPRHNKVSSVQQCPTVPVSPDKKYEAFTLASSVSSTPRRRHINLPLHIPEPLSMTRAAISSSSAMVAWGVLVAAELQKCGAGSDEINSQPRQSKAKSARRRRIFCLRGARRRAPERTFKRLKIFLAFSLSLWN